MGSAWPSAQEDSLPRIRFIVLVFLFITFYTVDFALDLASCSLPRRSQEKIHHPFVMVYTVTTVTTIIITKPVRARPTTPAQGQAVVPVPHPVEAPELLLPWMAQVSMSRMLVSRTPRRSALATLPLSTPS